MLPYTNIITRKCQFSNPLFTMIIPSPTPDEEEAEIVSSLFWPTISPQNIREEQRVDNTITPVRLRSILIEAIATTNSSMVDWRQQQGHGVLADIPAEKIDDVSVLVHRYRRAVGCLAKALLLERYRDFDSTGKGDKNAERLTDPIDDYRRDHLNAISDIIGQPRRIVELI